MISVIPIFLIGFSVCWYAARAKDLLCLPECSRLQKLLGFIFVWWSISTFKDIFFYFPGIDTQETLYHIFFIDGCGAITFALILMELTMPGWVNAKRTTLMAVPFSIFIILHLFIYDADWLKMAFTVFFVSFALCAVFIAIHKGHNYAKVIRDTYSNIEDVDISWVWAIVAAFTICQLIWWFVSGSLDYLADSFYYVSSLVCWSLVMRNINHMRSLRLPEYKEAESIQEPNDERLQKKRSSNLAGRLETLMEKELPYLNPDLTLNLLAEMLGTNRTYLSEYISAELDTTFYDYVNRLRIERKVIPMLDNPDNSYTLEYVAEQAGFKSITTFRRAFKKLTGMLPSEYTQNKDS